MCNLSIGWGFRWSGVERNGEEKKMTVSEFSVWLNQNASFVEAFGVGVGLQLGCELTGLLVRVLRQVKAGTTGGTSE